MLRVLWISTAAERTTTLGVSWIITENMVGPSYEPFDQAVRQFGLSISRPCDEDLCAVIS